MAYYDQEKFDVCCEWGIHGVQCIARPDVATIVDVLSFSTSVDVAVGRGAIVLPYRWNDESAADYARDHNAELAGRRNQKGATFTLAPSSLMTAPSGLRLVLPSPNGSSVSFAAMSSGAMVVAGCLRNASAVAAWAARMARRILVVPAGERWPDGALRPAVEDLIGAGAIIRALPGRKSPEAQAAIAAFEQCGGDLRDRLFSCSSGRELAERGFGADVEIAAPSDASAVVPLLRGDAVVAVA